MKALSRIKIKLKKFKFLIVGEVHESLNIDKEIKKYNLDKNVEIIGYTDFATFKKYIIISDIILNLRYPSAGETSAVLLRSLGFGNVNIAFDYESFADFPDDVLVKIPLDTSDTYFLEEAITRLLDNKTLCDMYKKNSKQHIEHHHDISEIAKQLNDFL
jgi:glycosyltransferase involved in cell wall biosynthesis